MNKIAIFCSALMLVFGISGNALAITNSVPDDDNHPYVGLLTIDVDGSPYGRCTGTLVGPIAVVTAGHCILDDMTGGRIWFDSDLSADPAYPFPGGSSVEVQNWFRHPLFSEEQKGGSVFYRYDAGLIILSAPVFMDVYAELPPIGLVDALPNKTAVDLVGYGVSDILGQTSSVDLLRRYATAEILPSPKEPTIIKLTANPGQGKGGACFGDSGGPNLLAGTNILLAINSSYTPGCDGFSSSTRLDLFEIIDPWSGN